jgi:twitching motility protein PilU
MLDKLLMKVHEQKASDLYISVGLPATIKLNGSLESISDTKLTTAEVYSLLKQAMDAQHFADFERNKEANYALSDYKAGRFRVSAFMQKEQPAMVIRRIEAKIPSFAELTLPEQLKEATLAKRGLILFVGATGAGKSTTQAAMIGYRNQHSSGHILTIEDPIEFIHEHGKSVVTQREVGIDTDSFGLALKNSLRQAPDVILIGEIRTEETMEFALSFSETGHLCMATLHANNANQALDRIMHLVPPERHRQFLYDLSVNLRAVVAQQLIPTIDGKGRRAAFEIMYNTPTIASAIRKGQLHELKEIMSSSSERGMQTFDQAIFKLYEDNIIGYTEALAHADSENDVRLMIKLSSKKDKSSLSGGSFDAVTLDM